MDESNFEYWWKLFRGRKGVDDVRVGVPGFGEVDGAVEVSFRMSPHLGRVFRVGERAITSLMSEVEAVNMRVVVNAGARFLQKMVSGV